MFVIAIFRGAHRAAGQLTPSGEPDARIASAARTCATVDGFFDCSDWRAIALNTALSAEEKEREWIRLYWSRVVPPQYRLKCAHEVRPRPGGPVKYWIVQLAQHPDAFWLMNDSVVKVEEQLLAKHYGGDDRLPGVADDLISGERRRTEQDLDKRIRDYIRQLEGPVRFDRIEEELVPEFFGRAKRGAYARRVKAMVKAGVLAREGSGSMALRADEQIRLL